MKTLTKTTETTVTASDNKTFAISQQEMHLIEEALDILSRQLFRSTNAENAEFDFNTDYFKRHLNDVDAFKRKLNDWRRDTNDKEYRVSLVPLTTQEGKR